MTNFIKQFHAADSVSTPLVAVRTFDQASTITYIRESFTEEKKAPSVIIWDCIKGLRALKGGKGADYLSKAVTAANSNQEITAQPREALRIMGYMSADTENTLVFFHNIHLFWTDPEVVQAIWNLRDLFKSLGNMAVLLISNGAILPNELANDCLVLEETLPTRPELEKIVKDTFKDAKLPEPKESVITKATAALIGLPAFPAEQTTAMCLDIPSKTLDISGLWNRKIQIINQTKGLSVYTGKDKFDDIGGLSNIKNFLVKIMEGNDPPETIIFIDEIEKATAGNGTDTSGVKTEMMGHLLSWMEDKGVVGIMSIGLPGVGKSQLPKTLGNKYGIPFIKFDLAGMQESLVGNSGTNLRNATAVVDAVSGGKVLAIATCNNIDGLPPELQSRFQLATFFFDAPTEEERASIWATYKTLYKIPKNDPIPTSDGWTGREIKGCCEKAFRLDVSLNEAAKYVVPCTISNRHRVDSLRRASSGKYLSASTSGFYEYEGEEIEAIEPTEVATGRKMKG